MFLLQYTVTMIITYTDYWPLYLNSVLHTTTTTTTTTYYDTDFFLWPETITF